MSHAVAQSKQRQILDAARDLYATTQMACAGCLEKRKEKVQTPPTRASPKLAALRAQASSPPLASILPPNKHPIPASSP
ncbi:hypothetical protein PIB30_091476, partial [Stylosanthes scabra]|nr:hypothetical protein [Stylosanthes scabra]